MTTWRDTASEQTQDDLDGLLSAVLPFAERTLAKYGEFFPFGAGVTADGQTVMIAADPALGEKPPPDHVLATLHGGVRVEPGSWRAAAFVADVTADGGDAIRVEIEHRERVAMVVLMPYVRDPATGKVNLGELTAGEAPPRIWTH